MDQLPTTAVSTLRLLAATQTEIDLFSDQIIQAVKNGDVDPLEILVYLKAFDKMSERVIKETKENQLTEANKWAESTFNWHGAEISKADTSVKYDYSHCGDPIWNQRAKAMEDAKYLLSEREAFLKALKSPMTIVDDSSGEVVTINPPKINRTAGLKVFIK